MIRAKKTFLTIFMFGVYAVFLAVPFSGNVVHTSVKAQNLLCDVFPFLKGIGPADSLCGGTDIEDQATENINIVVSLVRFGLSLVFVGIIGIAIFYIIKSAVKYIRSEGDEGKIEESTKAIKAVFIGIGALIVGIIGLVIILAIFNASGAVQQPDTPPQLLL